MEKQPLSFEQLPQVVAEILNRICDIQSSIERDTARKEEPPELLNADQAAKFIHIAKPTLYNLVSKRKIPHVKKGKRLIFYRSELLEYLNNGRRKTQESEAIKTQSTVDSILVSAYKSKKNRK